MTDDTTDQADGGSRRSVLTKIGAVAAGAWVAPQVLSTQAASAQSAPPCACPVAYANAYNAGPIFVPTGTSAPFPNQYLAPVGIALDPFGTNFLLTSAGTYRITYSLQQSGTSSSAWAVTINNSVVPFSGLDLGADHVAATRVVLITAAAADELSILNIGAGVGFLQSGSASPAASLLIELVV